MKKKRKERTFDDLVRNPYRVVIDGKGKSIQEIVDWYFTQIENGFQLTVQDITYLLDCSYDYVLENMAPAVLHIRITDRIRPYLFKAAPPESWFPLLTKRMLFSRDDLLRFLQERAKYELKFKRIRIQEIPELEVWMKENGFSFIQVEERMDLAFFLLTEGMQKDEKQEEETEREWIPLSPSQLIGEQRKWHSAGSIMNEMGFRYRVQAGRFLDSRGVNPIRLGKLARYLREEWEETDVLCYPYEKFAYLQERYGKLLYRVWIQTAKDK